MKKILLLLIIFFFDANIVFSIEDVVLETDTNKSSLDRLSDIYYGRVSDDENINPLLKLFSTKGITFKDSFVNSLRVKLLVENRMTFTKTRHENPSFVDSFPTLEPMISLKFNENKSEAVFNINFMRDLPNQSNWFTEKISQLYVSHKITENQTVYFGQSLRVPVNNNGSKTTMEQDLVLRSQLGRTLGNSRSVGIRDIGDYDFIKYDIGLYDSARYFRDMGKGFDFTGYLLMRPFYKVRDKIGNLQLGTGYNIGDYNFGYEQFSFFLGYDYKKFHIKTEYANADGYNAITESNNKADGYYTLISYDINPKLSLIGRYDYFNADKCINNYINEYTLGLTYKPYKNLKFMLNYVINDREHSRDSNMILFATRFII